MNTVVEMSDSSFRCAVTLNADATYLAMSSAVLCAAKVSWNVDAASPDRSWASRGVALRIEMPGRTRELISRI